MLDAAVMTALCMFVSSGKTAGFRLQDLLADPFVSDPELSAPSAPIGPGQRRQCLPQGAVLELADLEQAQQPELREGREAADAGAKLRAPADVQRPERRQRLPAHS